MQKQYPIPFDEEQAPPYQAADVAQGVGMELALFLYPLLVELDRRLDKRLVRTFLLTIEAIITFRDRVHGLLLSELGGYLLSAEQCEAGTKRLSNLIHSSKWVAELVSIFLWQRATAFLARLSELGEDVLAIWDESVWEKSESLKLEDLGSVRSSKARRLTHIKPGFYHPPTKRPICVPGMNWLGLVLVGRRAELGPPVLAAMQWWTNRGRHATRLRMVEAKLMLACVALWGKQVIHIFDRGFVSSPWLGLCFATLQRLILRWPHKDYLIEETSGRARKAWEIARGRKAWGKREIWDSYHQRWQIASTLAFPVRHPDYRDRLLWLVISRLPGRRPWYLLTTEPVQTEDDAWRVVFAYSRRWQIEMSWRYAKSELGFECPRLRRWEHQHKLLLMATLAYAFLLTLLEEGHQGLRRWLLQHYCRRRGRRARTRPMPLYRLRLALSRLWQKHRPQFMLLSQRRLE